jgi:hypothetical protein
MKQLYISGLSLIVFSTLSYSAQAQGSFWNLGFESASVYIPPSDEVLYVPTAYALPGWRAFLNDVEQTSATCNLRSFGSPNVGIMHTNFYYNISTHAIQGSYSAILQAGTLGTSVYSATITQNGLVPDNVKSIEARIAYAPTADFIFSLNGMPILMNVASNAQDYVLYRGDVSAFAGQSVLLSITAPSLPEYRYFTMLVDSIRFVPVPEPSTWALLGLGGGLAFCFRRRFNH